MAIRPRGTRFQVDVKVKGQRVRESAATYDEAVKLEADIRARLLRGENWKTPGGSPQAIRTLRWLLEDIWQEKWQYLSSGKGRYSAGNLCISILGEGRDIRSITPEDFNNLKRTLKAGNRANGTVNRNTSALSAMLTRAVQQQWIPAKPYCGRLKESVGRERQMSFEEEEALLKYTRHIEEHEYADFFAVAIDTGARTGELRAVLARDVDLFGKRLHITRSKNGMARSIPIDDDRPLKLLRVIIKDKRPQSLIFPGVSRRRINTVWDRTKTHLGLDDDDEFVPHIMRHTCACRLAQAGVPLGVIKQWMGHKNIATTLRYARYVPENLDNAATMLRQWKQERAIEVATEEGST